MPLYMVRVSYTADSWEVMLKNPQNRVEGVRPIIEKLGGKIVTGYLTLGDYDVVAIIQMPDNMSAAALSMAVMAGRAVKAVHTTPLITWEEGIEAMRNAYKAAYRPPSSSPEYLNRIDSEEE